MNTKSTIISIIGALVVGVILLSVEYSVFSNEPSVTEQAKEIVESLSIPPMTESEVSELLVEEDVGLLNTILRAAESINVYEKRNIEYQRIVNLALEEGKLGFAYAVASEINVYEARNIEYTKIVSFALDEERLPLAYAIAEKINTYELRNKVYKKIIDKGLELKENKL